MMVFATATMAGALWSPALDKTELDTTAASLQAVTVGPVGVTPVAYVATGLNFPDALGASPAAAIGDAPVRW